MLSFLAGKADKCSNIGTGNKWYKKRYDYDMSYNNKILIIAPSWVGDLVMSQALLRLIKKQDPDCSIDVFASPILHPLLKRMPEVNDCLVSPFKHGRLNLFERFKIAKTLRKNFYTHAYVLPNSFKSALIPFLANIPRRIGWCGEHRYFLLNDIRANKNKLSKVVENYLALGINKPIDVIYDNDNPQSYIDEVNEQGGLGLISHPDHSGSDRFNIKDYRWNDWSVK